MHFQGGGTGLRSTCMREFSRKIYWQVESSVCVPPYCVVWQQPQQSLNTGIQAFDSCELLVSRPDRQVYVGIVFFLSFFHSSVLSLSSSSFLFSLFLYLFLHFPSLALISHTFLKHLPTDLYPVTHSHTFICLRKHIVHKWLAKATVIFTG